jgi:hypothetical protein
MDERASLAPAGSRMLSSDRIYDIAGGFRASEILLSALELGLFTELAKGPRSCGQLLRTLGLDERVARDFLDMLVALDLLRREGAGSDAIYVNSRESDHFLDCNSPAYIGAELGAANLRLAPLWKELAASLRATDTKR